MNNRAIAVAAGAAVLIVVVTIALLWKSNSPSQKNKSAPTAPKAAEAPVRPRLPVVGKVEQVGFKTTANTGTSIELVGIANYPSQGTWWKADGTVQTAPLPKTREIDWGTSEGMDGYMLFIRSLRKGKDMIPDVTFPEPGRWLTRLSVEGDRTLDMVIGMVPSGSEVTHVGVRLQMGLDAGEKLVEVSGVALHKPHEHVLGGGRGTLKLSALEEAVGGSKVQIEYVAGAAASPFVNANMRINAYDAKNNTDFGRARDREDRGKGFVIAYDFQMPVEQVQRMVFSVRPVEYAEFQNVSLRAGQITKVRVIPLRAAEMETKPASRPSAAAAGN